MLLHGHEASKVRLAANQHLTNTILQQCLYQSLTRLHAHSCLLSCYTGRYRPRMALTDARTSSFCNRSTKHPQYRCNYQNKHTLQARLQSKLVVWLVVQQTVRNVSL
jgi:hypothetical protein